MNNKPSFHEFVFWLILSIISVTVSYCAFDQQWECVPSQDVILTIDKG